MQLLTSSDEITNSCQNLILAKIYWNKLCSCLFVGCSTISNRNYASSKLFINQYPVKLSVLERFSWPEYSQTLL
jgi:hypothetical protein